MIKSFRSRLALLSALLSGLALVAFGVGSWWLIRGIKLERMGSEVRFHAEREVSRERSVDEWMRLEMMVAASLGVRERSNLAILIEDGSGTEIFRSPHWPATLDATRFAWPPIQALPAPASRVGGFWMSEAHALEVLPAAPVLVAQAGRGPGARPGMGPGHEFGSGPGNGPGPFPGGGPGPDHRFSNDFPPPRERPPPQGEALRELPPPNPNPSLEPGMTPARTPAARADEPVAPTLRELPSPPLPTAPPPLPTLPTARDAPNGQTPPRPPDGAPPRPRPNSVVISQSASGHMWRVGLASVPHARLAVAMDAQVIDAEMGSIRNAYLIALPFAVALIGLGSWVFSARALRPVQRLTETTRKVTAEGLGQRISSVGEDQEFVELIEVFNRMLGRLERSFKQATRFSADAAHELKTPLAIVQGQLERTINMAEDGSPMQEELTSILDETRRLSTISRKLLLLSQADAGRLNVHAQSFDLSKALEDLLEDTRMLAPQLQVTGDIQPKLMVAADGSLLRQVLHNLISNAIKYNMEPGWIHITTARWAQRVEVLVSNSSRGIPKADRDKVFERFYRVDAAHSRQIEGVGLGLSVSRELLAPTGAICCSRLIPKVRCISPCCCRCRKPLARQCLNPRHVRHERAFGHRPQAG
jgi:two-component system heavy metal sensor histidine kinase CusS